jgi:hypothetical protein
MISSQNQIKQFERNEGRRGGGEEGRRERGEERGERREEERGGRRRGEGGGRGRVDSGSKSLEYLQIHSKRIFSKFKNKFSINKYKKRWKNVMKNELVKVGDGEGGKRGERGER